MKSAKIEKIDHLSLDILLLTDFLFLLSVTTAVILALSHLYNVTLWGLDWWPRS